MPFGLLLPKSCSAVHLLLGEQRAANEFHSAIPSASLLGGVVGDRLVFAVSYGFELAAVETVVPDQRLTNGFGPLL